MSICRSTKILRSLVRAAILKPKQTIAVTLLLLAALAGTLTYTGFLVIGVLADQLGTSRFLAGLLLGGIFARFPWMSKGKLRIVGLLPKPLRRALIVSILALCLLTFLSRGAYVPALFPGFAISFLLAYPWLKRAVWSRLSSSFLKFAAQRNPLKSTEGIIIDGEFSEKKDN